MSQVCILRERENVRLKLSKNKVSEFEFGTAVFVFLEQFLVTLKLETFRNIYSCMHFNNIEKKWELKRLANQIKRPSFKKIFNTNIPVKLHFNHLHS